MIVRWRKVNIVRPACLRPANQLRVSVGWSPTYLPIKVKWLIKETYPSRVVAPRDYYCMFLCSIYFKIKTKSLNVIKLSNGFPWGDSIGKNWINWWIFINKSIWVELNSFLRFFVLTMTKVLLTLVKKSSSWCHLTE